MANITIYWKDGTTNSVPDFDLSYWLGQGWSKTKPSAATTQSVPSTTKQFYRIGGDIYEAGTGRHIGPTEWNSEWSGKATEVAAPSTGTTTTTTPPSGGTTTTTTPPADMATMKNSGGYTFDETIQIIERAKAAKAAGETQFDGSPIDWWLETKPRQFLSDFYTNLGKPVPQTGNLDALISGLEPYGGGGNGDGSGTQLPSTGIAWLDEVLVEYRKFMERLLAQGQVVNPAVKLTPEQVKQFEDQAENEISPYYASQMRSIKGDLSANLQYLQQQYGLQKQTQEQQLKADLSSSREEQAGAGLAFSGSRARGEQDYIAGANRTLELGALGLSNQIRGALSGAEQQLGTRNVSDLFGFGNVERPLATASGYGGFSGTSYLSPYASPGNVTGSLEFEQRENIRKYENMLKQNARYGRTLTDPYFS